MPNYLCFGHFRENDAGHPELYFSERYTLLDFRGPLKIAPTAQFGFCNRIITQSHSIAHGQFYGPAIDKAVTVEAYAWVTSFCTLYDCTIGHHAIVSIGSVVAHAVIQPYTIVAGNPARPVAEWDGEKWVKVDWLGTKIREVIQSILRNRHE